ncbi:histidinol dehydrogenase [Seinonella peptonophila]|uniref:histidinol dehydrogenase n=1 Tax=Seinonella peptonophila TaxID=112248 RepID=UPI000933F868
MQIVNGAQLTVKRERSMGTARERQVVRDIIGQVQNDGDAALYRFTERFDGADLSTFTVQEDEFAQAMQQVESDFIQALEEAGKRIRAFHERQRQNSWLMQEETGTQLGQLIQPLERVGVYVPGGRAAYPSTVLMNVIPAQVAGVKEIALVTPPQADGTIAPTVLVAAKQLGISTIHKVGGAQAIAALAYGTETISPVDKIVGPGNIFVALAKEHVYGQVDIDSFAGPSEVVIIADDSAKAKFVAADLLSQAEHDPMAAAILITPSTELAEQVAKEVNRQLKKLPREEIAKASLKDQGAIALVENLDQAARLANQLAPEHLELAVNDPWTWLPKIKNAGAVFLGHYSPETVGDYYAGPNHVLPTSGTARFFSPLGVDSFIKRTNVIAYSREDCLRDADHVITLAEAEGLRGHANSLRVRVEEEKGRESE